MKKSILWIKTAILILGSAMCINIGTYAEEIGFTFERVGDDLVLSGELNEHRDMGTLMVVCPDKSVTKEYDTEIDYTGTIVAIDVFKGENGRLNYIIPIGEAGPFGTYTAYVKYKNVEYVYSASFKREGAEFLEEFRNKFNESGNKTDVILEYSDLTLLNEGKFNLVSEELRQNFETEMAKFELSDQDAVKDFVDRLSIIIKQVYFLDEINKATDEESLLELIKVNKSELGLLFDIEDEKNVEYKNSLHSALPIKDVSIFDKMNESFLTRELNAVSWGGFEKLIKAFPEIGIEDIDREIKGLTKDQKEKLFKLIAEAAPFSGTKKFCEVFADKKEEAKKFNPKPSGGGGSGGSGSGSSKSNGGGFSGGGGGAFVSTGAIQPVVNNQKENIVIEFKDLENTAWAEEAISYLAKRNVVSGKGDGMFAPMDNVKREEFVKMILNAFGSTVKAGKTSFKDVEGGSWYENYIYTAIQEGIVTGIDENTFGTGMDLSRQDAALLLSRVVAKNGKKFNITENKDLPGDIDTVAEYASGAVQNMFKAGIINGDENRNFRPTDILTRAEAAKMVYEIIRILE